MTNANQPWRTNRSAWIRDLRAAMPAHRITSDGSCGISIFPAGVQYPNEEKVDYVLYFSDFEHPAWVGARIMRGSVDRPTNTVVSRAVSAAGPSDPHTSADVDTVVAALRAVMADAAAMDGVTA